MELEVLKFKFPAGQIRNSASTARHHCDISSKGAVLPGLNDTEMGLAYSLHASAYYSENERFDLVRN